MRRGSGAFFSVIVVGNLDEAAASAASMQFTALDRLDAQMWCPHSKAV